VNGTLSFGLWLQKRRKALDLTQSELAQQVACSTILLRKIEAEERRPSKQIAERLADILKIPPGERAAFIRFARGEMLAAPQAPPTSPAEPWRAQQKPVNVHLPTSLTRLIGREGEVAEALRILVDEDTHLLTLIGPPGIGKTRLSLQVAAQCEEAFPDGVYFVALAAIADPELVATTILQTLALVVTGQQSAREVLQNSLRERRSLLVLDNFEQVIEAASLVYDLLTACPHLKALVTSRIALHMYGERLFPVPPLALPSPGQLSTLDQVTTFPAIRLFAERAQSVKPDFKITSGNAQAISEICTRLEGLPLAIELVAARTLLLSPQMLLSQWSSDFVLHAIGMRGLPERQQTLYNAIDWSYRLLTPTEQMIFARLGVFAGGWTKQAAEGVAGVEPALHEIWETLTSLAGCSLVVAQEQYGESRFTMLDMIREYALERLAERGEAESIRQRHAGYFLHLAETSEPELSGENQGMWLDRLASEHDNLRAVLNWSFQQGQLETAARLSSALWRFWSVRNYFEEGRHWLAQVVAAAGWAGLALPLQAQVLYAAGVLANMRADYARARALLEDCLALQRQSEDKARMAWTLGDLGQVAANQYDYARAQEYHAESLALMRELGDLSGIVAALRNSGLVALRRGEWEHGIAWYEECLPLARQLGDQASLAILLNNLGNTIQKQRGDFQRARTLLEESLAISRKLGGRYYLICFTLSNLGYVALGEDDWARAKGLFTESLSLARQWKSLSAEGSALKGLGWVAFHQGKLAGARLLVQEALQKFHQLNFKIDIAECFDLLAGIALANGEAKTATLLRAVTDVLRDTISYSRSRIEQSSYEKDLVELRAQLGQAQFASTWTESCTMELGQAIDYALMGKD